MRRIGLRITAAGVALALAAGCDLPDPGPRPTPSVTPSASPTPSPSPTGSASPSPTPTGAPDGWPNHASTGAPQEAGLPAGPCTLAANTVYDRLRFPCSTLQMAAGSRVTRSVIEGFVRDGAGTFTIEDSTITKPGCLANEPAVAYDNYTLRRVHIRGFNDGARVEGPGVRVYDSLIENCATLDGHADGLQVCPNPPCGGSADVSGLEFRHNTVTHPKRDSTGAVFVMGGAPGSYAITDNLLMGYSITVRLHAPGTFTGNRVVANSGFWGEADFRGVCSGGSPVAGMVMADNRYVTMRGPVPPDDGPDGGGDLLYGPDYVVASVGGPITCSAVSS